MKFLLVPAILFSTLAIGQKATPKNPPILTEAQKLAYYKAALEANNASTVAQQANQTAQQKQISLNEAIKAITDACGKEFHPDMDVAKGLVCVANPEPVKPAEVKK